MMKKIQLLFLLLFLSSCQETVSFDPDNDPKFNAQSFGEATLAEDTKVLSNEDLEYIEPLSVDSNQLVFSDVPNQWNRFQNGDIIISDVTKNTPYGLLRKVESVQQNGNQLLVRTSDATLEEALLNAEVSYVIDLDAEDYEEPEFKLISNPNKIKSEIKDIVVCPD